MSQLPRRAQMHHERTICRVVVHDQRITAFEGRERRIGFFDAGCRMPQFRGEPESRTFLGLADHPDFTVHQFGETFADYEPEPCATESTRRRAVGLNERLEKFFLHPSWNTDAGVSHSEPKEETVRPGLVYTNVQYHLTGGRKL